MDDLILRPWLALLPTTLLACLWWWRPARATRIAALAWGVYAVRESAIHAGMVCSDRCNIRTDLLLIIPLLILLTLWALLATFRKRPSADRSP